MQRGSAAQARAALQVHELPKKQADLNYFSERCAEMEQAMAQDPSRGRMYAAGLRHLRRRLRSL